MVSSPAPGFSARTRRIMTASSPEGDFVEIAFASIANDHGGHFLQAQDCTGVAIAWIHPVNYDSVLAL